METALLMIDLMRKHLNYGYNFSTNVFECGGIKLIVSEKTYKACIKFYNSFN